jgi:DNA-binding PadR family transcriptional regulator
MSLRHALLGMLATRPGTGYDLTQRFEQSLGNAWHASHSQIYPELARLTDAGLVEVVGEGARRSRTYGLTPAGHEEIRRWLLESEPNRAQRNETAVRWFLVALLEPEDRRVVLERELRNVEDLTAYLQETAERLDAMGGHPFRPTVDLGLRTGAVMDEWLREQIAATEG